MKMKIGKSGVVAALTAVLLITTVLITSCSGPAGGTQDGYKGPDGTGAVKINTKLSEGIPARTILPNLDVDTAFDAFTLSFQKKTNNTYATNDPLPAVVRTEIPDLEVEVYLEPGYWTLTLTALTGTGPYVSLATGTLNFLLRAGEEKPLTVPLNPVVGGSAEGDFTYSITLTSLSPPFNSVPATDDLKLTITSISPTPTYSGTYSTSTSIKGNVAAGIATSGLTPITLPTGYYYVDVALTVGVAPLQTVTIREVLHIYDDETSAWSLVFKNGQFYGWTEDPIEVTLGNAPELDGDTYGPVTSALTDALPITLSKIATGTEVITVTNADEFDSFEWFTNSTTAFTEGVSTVDVTNDTLTIEAGTAPFDIERTYLVGVVGTKGTAKYSTNFWVKITY